VSKLLLQEETLRQNRETIDRLVVDRSNQETLLLQKDKEISSLFAIIEDSLSKLCPDSSTMSLPDAVDVVRERMMQREMDGRRLEEANTNLLLSRDNLMREANLASSQLQARETETSQLKATNALLQKEITDLSQSLQDMSSREKELHAHCSVQQEEARNYHLKNDLQTHATQQQIETLSRRVQTLESQLASVVTDCDQLQSKYDSLMTAYQSRENTIVKLMQTEIDQSTELKALQDASESSNLQLSSKILSLHSCIEKLQTEIAQKDEKIIELQHDCEQIAEECCQLNEELATRKTKYAEKKALVRDLEGEIETLLPRFTKEVNDARKEAEEAQSELQEKEKEMNSLYQRLYNYERKLESSLQNLENCESDIIELKAHLDDIQEEAQAKENELQSKIIKLESKLQARGPNSTETLYHRLRLDYESLQTRYDELRSHFDHRRTIDSFANNAFSRTRIQGQGDSPVEDTQFHFETKWAIPIRTQVTKTFVLSNGLEVYLVELQLIDLLARDSWTALPKGTKQYREYRTLFETNSACMSHSCAMFTLCLMVYYCLVINLEFPYLQFICPASKTTKFLHKLGQINCSLMQFPSTERMDRMYVLFTSLHFSLSHSHPSAPEEICVEKWICSSVQALPDSSLTRCFLYVSI
jgi:DNA repair exonuclease SbcCD ATPase subunit